MPGLPRLEVRLPQTFLLSYCQNYCIHRRCQIYIAQLLICFKCIDKKEDVLDEPPDDYDTIGFGDGSSRKGALDKYCALERGYYFISLAMV